MGEIAEMMLDGTLCECCGSYIGSDAGYPQYCSDECAKDRGVPQFSTPARKVSKPARYAADVKAVKPLSCQVDGCGKRFATAAAKRNHRRMKHGLEPKQ